MFLKKCICQAFLFLFFTSVFSNEKEPRAMIWISPESPPGIWQNASSGNPYPADLIMKTVADIGFTDVLWQANELRGQAACYPTEVKFMETKKIFKNRDILEETLTAADKYGLKIWIVYTPGYQQPGTDIKGLNNPKLLKIYTDLIDELGHKYKPKHKSLYGIMQHEFNCAESRDLHDDDIKDFSDFCKKEFGEEYTTDKIPSTNGNDLWNRRFFLYKANIMTKFCKELSDTSARWGLKNIFCLYIPEAFNSNSATWGYDIAALEKSSDNIWTVASCKYYNTLKNPFVEVSVSYRGANLSMNFVNSFHGYPFAVFEVRSWLFTEATRKHYSDNKQFTKTYGDFYNGYFGRSEKAVELFQKKEYAKPLVKLLKDWQGAESKAEIGILSSSIPFMLRLNSPGIAHEKYVQKTLSEIKKHYPAELILLDSEKALDSNWLKRYKVIVIPPEVGRFMSPPMYDSLKTFCKNGGKLLSFSACISTSRRDLSMEEDKTKELFGIDPTDKDLPLLSENDNTYFLKSQSYDILCKTINDISPQPLRLENNKGFKIGSAIMKDSTLCIPLPAPIAASATLFIDTLKAGLPEKTFTVKDIMTGNVIATGISNADLIKGIKVSTKYDSQPLVITVGSSDKLDKFKGIYQDIELFKGMDNVDVTENPEVGFTIPDKPGIKVGIYANSYGADEIIKMLEPNKNYNCFTLPRLDIECLRSCEIIIIPQPRNIFFFESKCRVLANEVALNGKYLVMTHDAAANAGSFFYILKNIDSQKIIHDKETPLQTNNGQEFYPGFAFDNYVFNNTGKLEVLLTDKQKRAVAISTKCGKGKILLFGTLPGCISKIGDPALKNGNVPEGESKNFKELIEELIADKH